MQSPTNLWSSLGNLMIMPSQGAPLSGQSRIRQLLVLRIGRTHITKLLLRNYLQNSRNSDCKKNTVLNQGHCLLLTKVRVWMWYQSNPRWRYSLMHWKLRKGKPASNSQPTKSITSRKGNHIAWKINTLQNKTTSRTSPTSQPTRAPVSKSLGMEMDQSFTKRLKVSPNSSSWSNRWVHKTKRLYKRNNS